MSDIKQDKPIRVLHVLHSMNRGGTENAIMNYYRCIDHSKIQFDFLLTSAEKSDFEEEISSMGGRIYKIHPLTILNPFRYIKAFNGFLKTHTEYGIVHSHTSSKSVVPLAIAKYRGVPVRIAHSHSSRSESGINGQIRNFLKRFLKNSANVYFSCGEQAAQWLYGPEAHNKLNIELVRNVINADKFRLNIEKRLELRKKYDIDDQTLVIGHVARFCDVKNHKFSIDILKECLATYPKTKLLLVGDGPLKDEVIAHATNQGIQQNIILVGLVNNVFDYEQMMDVFILPSFYEGLPLSIIEAQVSGLPCFTTKGAVSKECSVTDLVSYYSLEEGAAVWSKAILDKAFHNRRDRYEEIKSAGYDATTSAEILQNKYIHLHQSLRKDDLD